MRAICVAIFLIFTPISQASPSIHEITDLFGVAPVFDLPQYETRYRESVAALYQHFAMSEAARIELTFQNASNDPKLVYLVEVSFCMKRNPRACLSERLQGVFSATPLEQMAKQELYFSVLSQKTVSTMAALVKNDELVMVTTAKVVRPWFWPDQVECTLVTNFRQVLLSGVDLTLPTRSHVNLRMRFVTQIDM